MPPLPETASYALAVAGGAVCALVVTLLGVWLGFRIATRDAALLGRFATEAREARALAEAGEAGVKLLREEWDGYLEQIERKRARATTERVRADQKAEAAQAPPVEEAVPLEGKERRRAIQRALSRRAMQ